MNLTDNIKELFELQSQMHKEKVGWTKHLISVETIFLGLMISLHREKSLSGSIHMMYTLGLALCAIAVLSGTIFLFCEVQIATQKLEHYKEWLKKRLNNQPSSEMPIFGNVSKVFLLFFYLFVSSSLLSMVSFVVYAIIKDL
jgi:hypothetical protein